MQKIFIAIALLLQFNAMAQSKIQFRSINQFGVLVGASENAIQLHSINGVGYKTFSAGIGVGFDNYYFKTIPFFLDLRKNLSPKEHTPFIYADIGYNFPKDKKEIPNQWVRSEYSGGMYYDVGVGYQIPLAGRLALNMSLGYAYKNMKETRVYSMWGSPADTRREYFDYAFRNATIKLGLSF